MRRIALILLMIGAPAQADEWHMLGGAQIREALSGRKLVYARGWQEFRASGRTLYNAGEDSWGYWQVRNDEYCSQWPPSGLWDCYRMAQNGDVLRFIDENGELTDGAYAE